MAKRENASRGKSPKGRSTRPVRKEQPALPVVNERNIDAIEKQTIQRVSKTLSALEVALATWDASKEKPLDLKLKYMKYRWLHEALSGWEKKTLQSRGKEDYRGRVGHLHEFVTICNSYAHG